MHNVYGYDDQYHSSAARPSFAMSTFEAPSPPQYHTTAHTTRSLTINTSSLHLPSRTFSYPTTPKMHPTELERPSSVINSVSAVVKQAETDLKSYLDGKDSSQPFESHGMSWEEFQKFRELAKNTIPDWDKLSVEYMSNTKKCIIQWPTAAHEIMDEVFHTFWNTQKNSPIIQQMDKHVKRMGSTEMDLQDGAKKQPDYSFADTNPTLSLEDSSFPTTIFEVAYTESSNKLAIDCGRFVACSLGSGLLAVGINIERNSAKQLEKVRCSKWECTTFEDIEEWPPKRGSTYYGRAMDTLYRSDEQAQQEEEGLVCGPATSFYCISRLGKKKTDPVTVFHAEEVESFLIFPVDETGPSALKILYRHIYRDPEDAVRNNVLMEIPCDLMLKVIRHHTGFEHNRKTVIKRKYEEIGVNEMKKRVSKRRNDGKKDLVNKNKLDSEPKAGPSKQK